MLQELASWKAEGTESLNLNKGALELSNLNRLMCTQVSCPIYCPRFGNQETRILSRGQEEPLYTRGRNYSGIRITPPAEILIPSIYSESRNQWATLQKKQKTTTVLRDSIKFHPQQVGQL